MQLKAKVTEKNRQQEEFIDSVLAEKKEYLRREAAAVEEMYRQKQNNQHKYSKP